MNPEQPLFGVIGPDRDGEEGVNNVCFSVPFYPRSVSSASLSTGSALDVRRPSNTWIPPPFRGSVERGVPSGPVSRNRADRALKTIPGSRPVLRTSATD